MKIVSNRSTKLANQALHADGARLGETTLMATLGGRPLGAGAAAHRQDIGWTG